MVGQVDGKVALVSGGARGLGAAYVRILAAEGARVVFGDVLDDEGAALAGELGDDVRFVHLDVTDPEQWSAAVEVAEEAFGPVTVLVNNAGIVVVNTLEDMTPEEFGRVIDVNLKGTFLGMRAVIPGMRRAGTGSIINVSSTAGLRGYTWHAGYDASKYGVRSLAKVAALELGQYGIRANSVHPGQVRTPMNEGRQLRVDHVALGRVGEPEELAALVLFLASDASSFCTGAEFVADGGETAGLPRPGHPRDVLG
ncbi:MAG: SDR family oxidoreductase [Acidimicrobiia bacterium]